MIQRLHEIALDIKRSIALSVKSCRHWFPVRQTTLRSCVVSRLLCIRLHTGRMFPDISNFSALCPFWGLGCGAALALYLRFRLLGASRSHVVVAWLFSFGFQIGSLFEDVTDSMLFALFVARMPSHFGSLRLVGGSPEPTNHELHASSSGRRAKNRAVTSRIPLPGVSFWP